MDIVNFQIGTQECIATESQKLASFLIIVVYILEQFVLITFEFVLVIFLSSIYANTLLLVSIFGLGSAALLLLCGGIIGRFFDKGIASNRRLQSIHVVICVQYCCILLCCAICFIIFENDEKLKGDNSVSTILVLLLSVTIIASAFANLCSEASALSLENDWIVVISDKNDLFLGGLNVNLRRVHIIAKMIGPIVTGYYLKITENSLGSTFLIIALAAICSFLVKYRCLARICSEVPNLIMQRENCDVVGEDQDGHFETYKICKSCSIIDSFATYFQQDIALGGLGFSFLYLNVMTGGDLMTSYLIWRGMPLNWLGILRGVAEITSLFGTFAFKWSSKRYPLKIIAVLSIAFMAMCLVVSLMGVLFVTSGKVSISMLVIGVIVSRIGLWANDLSITQLTQETVDEKERGIVGGSQRSLNALLYGVQFICASIWADPSQFGILCFVGFFAVMISFCLMMRGIYFSTSF